MFKDGFCASVSAVDSFRFVNEVFQENVHLVWVLDYKVDFTMSHFDGKTLPALEW